VWNSGSERARCYTPCRWRLSRSNCRTTLPSGGATTRNVCLRFWELGLRESSAGSQQRFEGATEVLEFLALLPSPEEILALRPSKRFDRHVRELLAKSREGSLNPQEEEQWERYEFLEHLVRMAKTRACLKLGVVPGVHA
jgi:hypothetical protein